MANGTKLDFKKLAAAAAKLDDQSITKAALADFEYTPPPAGVTVGRFIEYIELGVHPQKAYRGKPKNPAEEVRVTFELTHPKNRKVIGEGADKQTISPKITLTLTKHLSEKAKFKKLFEAMRYGRTEITHYAQMLGEPFVITIVHNESEKDGVKKTYANITDKLGNFLLAAPFKIDAISNTKEAYNVPAADSELKMFIWNLPNLESWNSLFIDGTRTKKDEKGNETEVSKNWIQAKVLSALNITGSALEQLLESNGVTTEELEAEPEEHESGASLDDFNELTEEEVTKIPEKKSATGVDKTIKKVSPKTESAKTVSHSKTNIMPTPNKAVVRNAKTKAEPVDPLVALGLK